MRTTQPVRVTEFITWTLLGVGTGLAAGLLLGEWLDWRQSDFPPAEKPSRKRRSGSAAATVAEVQDALALHASFASLGITVHAVAPGVVELGGWVDDRITRGSLARFADGLPGIDGVINNLLVHGEDDSHRHNGHQANSSG
ncbi:MAG: BON domain-containing protein [Gemmatimonadales bacterium]